MHPALSISELLNIIFAHLDQRSNLNNARVCKQWYHSSQAARWREINGWRDFDALFRKLAPIKWVDYMNKRKEFSEYPRLKDWERFEEYSKLVRTISLDDSEKYNAIFDIVGQTRPYINIFPNLYTLQWNATRKEFHYLLFVHPNVKEFIATLPPTSTRQAEFETWVPLFVDSISRMPLLQHLEIRCDEFEPTTRHRLLEVIKGLRCLRTILLPRYHITARIIEEVSLLPHLKKLSSQETGIDRTIFTFPQFDPCLRKEAFPSLTTLSICADVQSSSQFLSQRYFPSNIRRLHLEMPSLENPGAVRSLLETVAGTCTLIEEVSFRDQDVHDHREMTPQDQIGLETLRPVFACPMLTTLEIRHHYPLALGTPELEILASELPSIETLLLNEGPIHHPERSPLTLDVLLIFSSRCRKLQKLGLYVDASVSITHVLDGQEFHGFPELRSFSVGLSHIEDAESVALFLGQICPPNCEVALAGPETRSVRRNMWRKVNGMLPTLAKMRLAERERIGKQVRMLEVEVERLRALQRS
ncbi:hypothetical protein BDZ94DRAFT_984800 [Collybia nuda]|uniref:F-box domain-containing protein n=1 Tax=Collybia nuda TaxID=64659 RepID=A0A9P6CBS8_9AGAR|nr:hypothetical protein BDZ94DRAFT_984800 [Collybia nuda]